jgi:spore coat polysaccharide biosynthesis protein SpsF
VRTIGVVQARMTSNRLPGKALAMVGDRPLVLWTMAAMRAVPSLDGLVAAIPDEASDDGLADVLHRDGYEVHRGSTRDVLARCWDAVRTLEPDVVVRQTADNPFMDPAVVDAQVGRLVDAQLDYVGIEGWPLGIAGEAVRATAMSAADAEATDPAEREHVLPFIYRRPNRFAIGALRPTGQVPSGRFTVDTDDDLAFARAIAARLEGEGPASIAMLRAILIAEPALLALNQGIRQKGWEETER